ALLAQGDRNEARKQIEYACCVQPNIAYLHEIRANVLVADNHYEEAFAALDRAAVLRAADQEPGLGLEAVVALARMAVKAKRAVQPAVKPLNRAATRHGLKLDSLLQEDDKASFIDLKLAIDFFVRSVEVTLEAVLRTAELEPGSRSEAFVALA